MDPLELVTKMLVGNYGMKSAEARERASLIFSRANDITLQAIKEAQAYDSDQRERAKQPKPLATLVPPPRTFGVADLQGLTVPGVPPKNFSPDSFQGIHAVATPAPIPSIPAAATPAHTADADLSAWQRYSDILKTIPKQADLTSGVSSGRR